MRYLSLSKSNDAYPALQSTFAPGLVKVNEDFVSVFQENNGFVNVVVESDTVVKMTPNTEARNAWLATLPEPEAKINPVDKLRADLDYTMMMTGVI